ncbi:hypothetical protein [Ruminococcus albus]|uniref:Uncharacterized protein n=1 Tax=Ruminococcus albus (strain ATCC 27210 / DSM 20455 / JCM 14654 / NCDO 2250 / 7) TaxID=697329 RepID=E6UKC0_RUMA7|nr:hypothetical protein [Ruminococcus albus]ADU24116.1 hypothetical protein Rumal_3678 [Ruminococcus albus 7 = DSM 20455]
MNFYGFKLNTRDFDSAEKIVEQVKRLVYDKAQKIYRELLSHEIQVLTDECVVGLHDNDKINCIYDAATELLQKKIAVAIAKGLDTEYNFNVVLNMFSYNKEIYIQIATYNFIYYKVLLDIKDMRDLSIHSVVEQEERDKRVKLWENIIDKYKDHSCFTVKVFPTNDSFIKPDFKDLIFDSPMQRAEVLARHRVMNQYLSLYAGGGTIQPEKLMEYYEQAFMKLDSPEGGELREQYKSDLLRFLPVIEEKIVMTKMTDEAPINKQLQNILEKTPGEEQSSL